MNVEAFWLTFLIASWSMPSPFIILSVAKAAQIFCPGRINYISFKSSLIIHKENTKEITTVAVVLYVIKQHVYFPKT